MGTSPDVFGSRGLGRPQNLDYQEQQQTSQVINLKAGLGMVETTLEIPLEMVGGDIYKYQTTPSKPNLDSRVLLATQSPELPEKNPAEEAKYQEILDKLPLQLSLELQDDQKKPEYERNPKFVVFEMILRFVAKALVWLESVSQIDSSQHTANIAKIQAFPHAALRGWIEVAESIRNEAQSSPAPLMKTSQGRRDGALNAQILKKLISYARMFLEVPEDKKEKFLKHFEKELMSLQAQLEKKRVAGIFTITEILVEKLTLIIASCHCEVQAAPLIGWTDAAKTLFSNQKENLCFGKTLQTILIRVAEESKTATYFQKKLLPRLMGSIILIFPMLTLLASGKRTLKEKKDPRLAKDNIQSLAIRLGSCLIAHSCAAPLVARQLYKAIRLPAEELEAFVDLTDVMGINLLILTAAEGKNEIKTPTPILRGVEKVMSQRLEKLREAVRDSKPGELIRELNAGIRQADIALKREDDSWGYLEAVQRCLTPLKLKIEDLEEESEDTISVLASLLRSIEDMKMQTDFMRAVIQAA